MSRSITETVIRLFGLYYVVSGAMTAAFLLVQQLTSPVGFDFPDSLLPALAGGVRIVAGFVVLSLSGTLADWAHCEEPAADA